MLLQFFTILEPPVPMSTTERAAIAGRASQAKKTPEERREAMRHARLSAAVKAVVDRAPDLSEEQRAILRRVFGGASA